MIDWSFNWPIDWLIDQLVCHSIDHLIDLLACHSTDHLIDWTVGSSFNCLVDWLNGWLSYCFVDSLIDFVCWMPVACHFCVCNVFGHMTCSRFVALAWNPESHPAEPHNSPPAPLCPGQSRREKGKALEKIRRHDVKLAAAKIDGLDLFGCDRGRGGGVGLCVCVCVFSVLVVRHCAASWRSRSVKSAGRARGCYVRPLRQRAPASAVRGMFLFHPTECTSLRCCRWLVCVIICFP